MITNASFGDKLFIGVLVWFAFTALFVAIIAKKGRNGNGHGNGG